MPVSFNSPARNLFLLGSSGGTVVTNFFKTILDSSTDGVFSTKEISYNYSEQNYILSGSGSNNNSVGFGWLEKRDYDAETDPDNPTSTVSFANKIQSTTSSNLILNDIELDSNNNIIACGITGSTPWIAKYSNAGVLDWNSTSNSGEVEYKNITSDSNGEYYASGNTTTSNSNAFIEKFDSSGNPTWGKSATILGRDIELNGIAVNDRSEVVSVGWLEDDSRTKAYLVKVDTANGSVLWDKTFSSSEISGLIYTSTLGEDVFIDSEDNIYMVGKLYNSNDSSTKSFIIKLSPEGNIIWQKETDENIEYYRVKADGDTGQVVTFGRYYDSVENDQGGLITKYTRGGDISWRRSIFSSYNGSDFFGSDTINGGGIGLDADASFYYVLYTDDERDALNGTPTSYTFGKVSTSGNGLGGFEYDDGESETVYYDILNSTERIGRLSDGSVRNDTSDLITYPFNATRIAFDDYATHVSNKKRQMDDADSFEYSGSPAIRPADFSGKNIRADVTSLPNQPRQNYIGDSDNITPDVTSTTDYGNKWRRQSTAVVVTANAIANPLGTGLTAELYNLTATAGRRIEYGGPSVVAGQRYTYSWWMKAVTTNAEWTFQAYNIGTSNNTIRIADRSGNILENISTTNTTTYKPTDTEWHRVVWSFDADSTATVAMGGYNSNNETGNLWYLYGAQMVDGDSPGNYYQTSLPQPTEIETLPTTDPSGYWLFDGDGSNDFIQIPHDTTLHNEEMSWEWWMWNDTIRGDEATAFFTKRSTNTDGYMIFTQANGSIYFDFGTPADPLDRWFTGYSVSSNLNQWIHCVMTRSSSGRAFYVNGTQYAITSDAGAYIPNTQDLFVGTDSENPRRYEVDGRIGEFRIYPRALTAGQVFQNYNATKSKYINEAPDTAPKISDSAIVYDSNLLLNYDFGNRATYNPLENLFENSNLLQATSTLIPTDWGGWNPATFLDMPHLNGPFGDKSVKVLAHGADNQNGGGLRKDMTGLVAGATYTVSAYVRKISEEELAYWNANNDLGLTTGTDNGAQDVPWFAATRCRWDCPNVSGTGDGAAAQITLTDQWQRIERDFPASSDGNKRIVLSNNVGDTGTGNEDGGGVFLIAALQLERKYNTLYGGNNKAGLWFATGVGQTVPAPTTVKNLSSNSINLPFNNGATFNSNGWFEFDGTNQDIFSGTPETIVYNGGTFEAWLYFDDVSNNRGFLTHSAGGTGPYINFYMPGASQSKMRWEVIGITTQPYTTILSNTVLTTGQWYHFVGTFDGASTTTLYINGTQDVQQTNMSNQPTTNSSAIRLGEYAGFMDGRIGQSRIYNRALTATEVSQNFNATRSKYGV
ncbi:hypothetical protein ES420910_217 [Cyanophage S-RIM44]|uniref:LamG-like jellyroll fold domain-containing protein n=1 Tax=Cyanophage S-RIM44 TaxID=1278485 RepID=A0A1D7SDF7_9CAUD|nr:hypothetical protein ES420910_217 [Cyanophage S-RIM44]